MNLLNYITPNNHKAAALWAFVFIIFGLFSTSCIYEYLDDNCFRQYGLRLEFDTDMTEWLYNYTETGSEPVEGQTVPLALQGEMTYIIHAYPVVNGNVKRDNYEEYTYTREVDGNYDFDTTLNLEPGDYHIMVWADFRIDGKSYYYYADNFAAVSVDTDPYTGNTDYRDAFTGTLDIKVGETTKPQTSVIAMERPLARYEFIATNADEFLEAEQNINPQATLDDYYVVVSYPQFMPSEFNMFTDRPSNSETGINYDAVLTGIGNNEIDICSDFVFVNHNRTAIATRLAVYDRKDNRLAARTELIRIPLLRNHNTIVRGKILLSKASGGVGIDPDFEGDIDLTAPLVPSDK